jgi:hypothetical protein
MGTRFAHGFGWGVIATVAMSVVMFLGMATGMSPMPEPIPVAILATILGEIPRPLLFATSMIAHLTYGGLWAGIFATIVSPVTVRKGIGLGVGLWFLMQTFVLPFLGWGPFGIDRDPAIPIATLILHLVYGVMFGWLMDERRIPVLR